MNRKPFKLIVCRGQFKIGQTPKGTPRLTYEGYKYGVDGSKSNGRAVIRKCTARANLKRVRTLLLKNRHTHPPPLLNK